MFTILIYGLKLFDCKTVQFCVVRCEYLTETA